MLGNLTNQIIQTEFRDDPAQSERMMLLRHLEPLSRHTIEETGSLANQGMASIEDAIIKANFNEYIDRFERKNATLFHFGKDIELVDKIKNIQAELKKYASKVKAINIENNNTNGRSKNT